MHKHGAVGKQHEKVHSITVGFLRGFGRDSGLEANRSSFFSVSFRTSQRRCIPSPAFCYEAEQAVCHTAE